MGSEPDLSQPSKSTGINLISRDGSFTSVNSTSASSRYFTAKEDGSSSLNSSLFFSAEGSGAGDLKQDIEFDDKESPPSDLSLESLIDSATLEEADSIRTSDGDDNDNMVVGDIPSELSFLREDGIEVREDISRLCNTIAESEDFDDSKRRHIEVAIRKGDLTKLGELAVSYGGLLSNGFRTRAWPLLLKISQDEITRHEHTKIPSYAPHVPEKIKNLVNLDVARVLKRFPPGLTDPQQDHLQMYLSNIICSVLQENPKAYYYQGFHDISLTFLMAAISQRAPYLAYLCLNKMIETNLCPYMEKTMDKTHDVIHVLFALLESEDPVLYKKIVVECRCPVAFCLPWVLTWFSHTLPSDTDVFRVYDFVLGSQELLSQPFLVPIFVSAALLLRNSRFLKQDKSLTDVASMHHRIAKLPSELSSLEPWLEDSMKLMKKYKGREIKLLDRGVSIKVMQNRLWNEDNNNRRPRPQPGILVSASRFLFVRYKWATISVAIVGAAFLIQSRYGRIYTATTIKTMVQYAPERFQNFIKSWLIDEASDE